MNLNKENLKKIRGLIVFTVILLIALWNYSLILDVLGQGVGIVYPFLLGGAIAFVINVPMSFFEEKLFQKPKPSSAPPSGSEMLPLRSQ